MTRVQRLRPQPVDEIPELLDTGVLYISLGYATAMHLCACGCGVEVVTPLGRPGWSLTYDGTASLSPSVGNGNFSCRSHYYVSRNNVEWLPPFGSKVDPIAERAYGRPPAWWKRLFRRH